MSKNIAVIGAGPGGYAAAFYAADLGMQVTLIDPEVNPGGVCLYRGCIPSKALLHIAKVIDEAQHASAWGLTFGEPKIDLDKMRGFKDSVVQKLTGGNGQLVKARKITYIQGMASFVDATTLEIAGKDGKKENKSFDAIIIATGSHPTKIPKISIDSPKVLDSTSALDLPDIPKRLLVVGGGYIGLELGSVYAALGSKVSVVEMTDGLLQGADRDLVKFLHQRLEKKFEALMFETKVIEVKDDKKGLTVTLESKDGKKSEESYDRVLVSVGRKPNSKIAGLDKTKVQVDERGFIRSGPNRQTDEPTIFVVGDVAGEPMLAHKASHEARVAVEAIEGQNVAFEPAAIPAVVFTDPEIAWAGLTETEAKQQGRKVEIARFPWAASGRAITLDRTDGVTKLVIDPDTERILGVGICGPGAGELISEGVLAVEMAALATDLKLSIHPHPTTSETVMEAAEVFFGQATHVHRPKKR
ncbi:MAG TPA: dihydrolipoyl dehydrogenase [Vicinamibacterales bacterium]|nr:dihydrolipoyl dehydrogenase [Vicinamibacterales bacterium]